MPHLAPLSWISTYLFLLLLLLTLSTILWWQTSPRFALAPHKSASSSLLIWKWY